MTPEADHGSRITFPELLNIYKGLCKIAHSALGDHYVFS